MPAIAISGRRFGKTAAAAQAAGMSIDSYRTMQRKLHDDGVRAHEAARAASDAIYWSNLARITRSASRLCEFMHEYMATFEEPCPVPIVITTPGRDDWLRRWMTGSR